MKPKKLPDEMFVASTQAFRTTGKQYRGIRYPKGTIEHPVCVVTVLPEDGRPYELVPATEPTKKEKSVDVLLRYYFDWGVGANKHKEKRLAKAILADLFGSLKKINWCESFVERVISKLPEREWRLNQAEIEKMYEVELTLSCLAGLGEIQ